MKNILIALFLILGSYTLYSQNEKEMKTALLIVDVQEFYFVEGNSQLINPEAASEKAALLLNHFRKNNNLVVHIKHASSSDSAIHENVKPLAGEKVITKHHVNSYRETDLLKYLEDNKIEQVVICGMMTHLCVEAAARASADNGFKVTVIENACATRNIEFNNEVVKAADVHNSTLATINKYYGKVTTVEDYIGK